MIEFSELQSYYCQSICQRMFFSVLSTAKSIPEQMSKSQRCNFLHAAFRFSPHPPIIHHSSPPSFVIINQYPIFILNISILHHAHVSALTTLGFKDYIEPFTSSTTTSSAISRAREKVATGAAHQQKADTPLFAHNGVVGYGIYVMPLCYGRRDGNVRISSAAARSPVTTFTNKGIKEVQFSDFLLLPNLPYI
jgi:hypothetical protein